MPGRTTADLSSTAFGEADTPVATRSTEELLDLAAETSRRLASLAAHFVTLIGELDRRQGWREEGATSLEAWIVERCGTSVSTARAFAHVAERLFDLPHLAAGLAEGELSFDKVRAVVERATPERDEELAAVAKACSVRQLAELARTERGASAAGAAKEHAARSLRFNDACRTMTAQLPQGAYAEVRACLEARAKEIAAEDETTWDQRLCDGFVGLVRAQGRAGRGTSPYVVVAHVAVAALLDVTGQASELCADLERGGLLSLETLRQVACEATIVLAVDDDVGHTMYEGRARRAATPSQRREVRRRDRHCRFPGCANVTFADVHHIVPWTPEGRTDLDNLALLCEHHHGRVHSEAWTMSGNANEELHFVGPTGREMTSRPSPIWTRATRPRR
jgi:hypothetical protein